MTTKIVSIDNLCEQLREYQAEAAENDEERVVLVGEFADGFELVGPADSEHDAMQVSGDAVFDPDVFANSEGIGALQNADPSMFHTLTVCKSDLSEDAKAELLDEDEQDDEADENLVCDGGMTFADLHAFERDLLYAVRALEHDGDAPKGLAIKSELEANYGEEINHSRLYQNLDGLIERGLLTKGQKDDRTNEYATTDQARDLLERHAENRAEQVGIAITGGDA